MTNSFFFFFVLFCVYSTASDIDLVAKGFPAEQDRYTNRSVIDDMEGIFYFNSIG